MLAICAKSVSALVAALAFSSFVASSSYGSCSTGANWGLATGDLLAASQSTTFAGLTAFGSAVNASGAFGAVGALVASGAGALSLKNRNTILNPF
jgi:hypothetical protein